MIRLSIILFCLCVLLGCSRGVEDAPRTDALQLPPPPTEAHADIDIDNLLNIAYGASVVSRTGEQSLEQSAVHAIDGMGATIWASSPAGASQTMVFTLPTESRIDRLGVTVSTNAAQTPREVKFEISTDGEAWREVLVMQPQPIAETQIEDILPSRATHVRVSTVDTERYFTMIRSIHAVGRELSPLTPRDIAGCWTVNGTPARFLQQGTSITGALEGDSPMIVDGGIQAGLIRLMWMQSPAWGYAALTVAPDGRTLSALTFHEEVVVEYAGAAWFGQRTGSCEASAEETYAERFLDRTGRWSMFGLEFTDDRLIAEPSKSALDRAATIINSRPSSRFAIVVHEFRAADAIQNRHRASARLEQIRAALQSRGTDLDRVVFEAAGSDRNIAPITLTTQRFMASRADLELR